MSHSMLRELFLHHDWAWERLLSAAGGLSDEQIDRSLDGTGPLRVILHHMWAAERLWLDRWTGKPVPFLTEPEPDLPLAELGDRVRVNATERDAFLDEGGDAAESRRITCEHGKGKAMTHALGDMMLHVTNHGVHHRAQALGFIRRAGGKVPSVDYLFYKLERPSVALEPDAVAKLNQAGVTAGASTYPAARLQADTIRDYYRYADWARERVHAVARTLGAEDLDRPFEAGVGTIRRTLLHIHDAEKWWSASWSGSQPGGFVAAPETTSIAELDGRFDETAAARDRFLDGLAGHDLARVVRSAPAADLSLAFRLGESMLQLCTHGTHHRGQVLNMLRVIGADVPSLDYLDWVTGESRA